MSILRIEGGRPLRGSVHVQGAKNSVLPILAGTFLARGVCVVHNCPRLTDVEYTHYYGKTYQEHLANIEKAKAVNRTHGIEGLIQ